MRQLVSCIGDVRVERGYWHCASCGRGGSSFDRWAGLRSGSLTAGGRQLVVLAGSRMSYDQASVDLQRFCGIRVSDQTIRRACDAAGDRAREHLESERATRRLAEADGQIETSTDGAKVNTTEGWREVRAVVIARREAGGSCDIAAWDERQLPAPHTKLAWAGVVSAEQVGRRWRTCGEQLGWGLGEGVSVVADGAAWIWKQATQHLPEHEAVVDVYHVLEHVHEAARTLHGQSEAARQWAERQRELLFRWGAQSYLKAHLAPQVRAARAEHDSDRATALRSLFMYLWRHRGRLRYADRLRRGLPIGSGQIEGVCKNTLNRRLRKNSPRWRPENADRMAALCCLHTSNQWDDFWPAAA